MKMYDLQGLKIEHSSNVTESLPEGITPGWYIFIKNRKHARCYTWEALLTRFTRYKDAALAMDALIREGLDSKKRMQEAGPMRVYQVMFESLEW